MSDRPAQSKDEQEFAASGFFVLRTPLLPFDDLLKWSSGLEAPQAVNDAARLEQALTADRARLRERLQEAVERPEIGEALFVASPSLHERTALWLREPDSKRGQKVERAIIRYFLRMTARPTPFGLFAGCSVGTLGPQTRLVLPDRGSYQRHTRLDMDYLCTLTAELERVPEIRNTLTFRPNSSLYHAAGRLRYAEARLKERVRSYHLVALDVDEYLTATLERAAVGALPGELAEALADADPDISLAQAEEYVNELIDSQVLVSQLTPAVTGLEPLGELVATLEGCPATAELAVRLRAVDTALQTLDAEGLGAEPQRYQAIATALEELPAKVELSRLFQVDIVKPTVAATLAPDVIAELVRGVETLHRLTPRDGQDRFATFRAAFTQRYGDREVPLVEALDEEVGVGFARSSAPTAEASPLLDGLLFPSAAGDDTLRWGWREAYLLRKLQAALAEEADELVLTAEDLQRLEDSEVSPLPDAFALMATVESASEEGLARGDFRVILRSVAGPSGGRLLGRFCHADETLHRHLREHLRADETLQPDAVFAEIVHLPEGRIGNILSRPVLRDYEIPFLGRSGAPPDRQLPVQDLLVSVVGERVLLRSARLGREVRPRLTSAHNYTWRSPGVYRFLCELQDQGVAGALTWSWGPLESARFLPRVSTGRLVLSRARWLVDQEELKPLIEARGRAQFQAIQAWRTRRRLPRLVALAEADNELPVDFDNVLSVETFIHLAKDRPQVRLVEMTPLPDKLCARGPEGRFTHEIVVPFVRTRRATQPLSLRVTSAAWSERNFPPGSEWLYAKLYTGTSTADRVLSQVVGPFARQAVNSGAADRWYFIRYSDPDWHLRLRLHGDPQTLQTRVLPELQQAVHPLLEQGGVSRLQLDTYEREVERYGGVEGAELAERIFQVDSEAVLAIVELLTGDEGADARWRLTLRGIDMLLGDLGFDLPTKQAVMKGSRAAFGQEFRADKTYLKVQLGDKFRQERRNLETLLDPAHDDESPLRPGLLILRQRSEQLAPLLAELKAAAGAGRLSRPLTELAPSYAHMHANRLLRSAQRAQELVLYDFLNRIYESRAARQRKQR